MLIDLEADMINGKGPATSCHGPCADCHQEHYLSGQKAYNHALRLIDFLDKKKRIDFLNADHLKDHHFSTDYLFGQARGQMFGVMTYQDPSGHIDFIPAFSGQYNGRWELKGWAPPLFDVNQFNLLTDEFDPQIKKLGMEIKMQSISSVERKQKIIQRKNISRQLMKDIHDLYNINNFKGENRSIYQAFQSANGIPTGAGDCCAPKLLNYAAVNNLTPLGIAEFYWGKENRSQTRKHGNFYPSCTDKCQPLLGFMLCGLQ